jgi:hypothetical protein
MMVELSFIHDDVIDWYGFSVLEEGRVDGLVRHER